MITIHGSSRYKLKKSMIRAYTEGVLQTYLPDPGAVLNIILVGKRKMRMIASQYKHEDVALPILSFSYLNDRKLEDALIGELFICYPQAVLLAAEREKKVDDMMKQLIEHGIKNIFTK